MLSNFADDCIFQPTRHSCRFFAELGFASAAKAANSTSAATQTAAPSVPKKTRRFVDWPVNLSRECFIMIAGNDSPPVFRPASNFQFSKGNSMEYVNLGRSGTKVSRLCLGMMTYGNTKWRAWVLEEKPAGR